MTNQTANLETLWTAYQTAKAQANRTMCREDFDAEQAAYNTYFAAYVASKRA